MTTPPAHKERAHAECSASSSERWLNCPGSVKLSRGLPGQPSSPAALEGTRCHELAERILRRWLECGRELSAAWVESLRPEYADTAGEDGWGMLDYAMTYVNCCLDEVAAFDCGGKEAAVQIERRLTLDKPLGLFGTVDFFATGLRGGRPYGVVIDLKYGRKKVKTEANPQLSFYGVALKKNSKKALEAVKIRVVQPRISEFYSEREYGVEELKEWDRKLREGASRALKMADGKIEPELKPGSWCYFCPAWAICPERQKMAAREAVKAFDDDPLPLVLVDEEVA